MGRNLGIQSSASSCSSGVVEQCGTLIFCCPFLLCRTDWRRSPKRIPFNEIFLLLLLFFLFKTSLPFWNVAHGYSVTFSLVQQPTAGDQLTYRFEIVCQNKATLRIGRQMDELTGRMLLTQFNSIIHESKKGLSNKSQDVECKHACNVASLLNVATKCSG